VRCFTVYKISKEISEPKKEKPVALLLLLNKEQWHACKGRECREDFGEEI
jgi:hypothetical protein